MQTGARPVAAVPAYGSQDFCVRAEGSIQEIYKELQKKKAPLEPEMGIVKRIGALGEMQSVYLRDPDGNLVEICVYSAEVPAGYFLSKAYIDIIGNSRSRAV